jgi:hypothetical protein
MLRDDDQRPFSPPPDTYVSPFAWDGADQLVFRPLARLLAVDPAGPAVNVNAYDEVPDSSWFENRIGRASMTADEMTRGPCGDRVLDPNAADGTWVIDQGKPNGANPGFRVNIPGVGKFLLKADMRDEPERATGATAIAARLYHAAGYFAPCDSVVYFRPELLRLLPGLTVTDNSGVTRPFDAAALAKLLARASHRGPLVRMGASRWLPGMPVGPYRYEGTRADDPNDVVPHEDRRELRGARVLAAWLNHFDSREQNTMDVFMSEPSLEAHRASDGAFGYVRHYILDLGDCFGSVWQWDAMSRRLGFAYYLDFGHVLEDFVSFGAIERPWERQTRDAGIFNYFSAREFDPEAWHGGYPNPAFTRMTEADAAWMTRIIAHFSDELIESAVASGRYDPASSRYLTGALQARRDIILRRYLSELSPLADLKVDGDRLCARDLARQTGVVPENASGYSARASVRDRTRPIAASDIEPLDGGRICIDLSHVTTRARPAGYVIVDIWNGHAPNPLRAHVYDLGPKQGLRLVGIERI